MCAETLNKHHWSLAQYRVNALSYMHNSIMEVWFSFEEISSDYG